MEHERAEEREAMAAFTLWRLEQPDAGFVVGTVVVDEASETANVRFAHAGCGPVALLTAASELLDAAYEALEADPFDESLNLLACIDQARDVLGIRTPRADQ